MAIVLLVCTSQPYHRVYMACQPSRVSAVQQSTPLHPLPNPTQDKLSKHQATLGRKAD